MTGLRARISGGERLCGTFVKTPAPEVVEVLAQAGLDFIVLDAEHSPFDRMRLDSCLAVARALGLPALVRVPVGARHEILMALDSGAAGVVVPHVVSAEMAADIARWARFGHHGRGYAGATRWADWGARGMAELLKESADETVALVQIEEPEGVEAADAIAATEGVDGLFIGPADLAVCLGETDITSGPVRESMARVGEATKRRGKGFVTFAPHTGMAADLRALGVTTLVIGSEHGFMLAGARQVAADLK